MVPGFQGRNGRNLEVNLAVPDTLAKRAFERLVICRGGADYPERLGRRSGRRPGPTTYARRFRRACLNHPGDLIVPARESL